MRRTSPARVVPLLGALLGIAVLLSGCQQGETVGACDVDPASAKVVAQREDAGLPDCSRLPVVDDPADGADLPDLALDCLGADGHVSLADLRGPVLVNFWSSNCGPCRKELPALAAFDRKYGDQVPVVGVDYLDTYPEAAVSLAADSGVDYPSLADACGDLMETELVVQSLPQFVAVGDDGSVQQAAGGLDSVDEVVAFVQENLGVDVRTAA